MSLRLDEGDGGDEGWGVVQAGEEFGGGVAEPGGELEE